MYDNNQLGNGYISNITPYSTNIVSNLWFIVQTS
jgi:hypothetical protein